MKQTLSSYVDLTNSEKKTFKAKVRAWLLKDLGEERFDDITIQTEGMNSFVVPTRYAGMLADYVKSLARK
jgi:hypothetical protein